MKKNPGRPREFDPKDFLNAALGCFWLKGYQGTSISDLMQASGLASASIYKLYPDKRSIFFAALSQYMEEGLGRMRTRAEEKPPAVALRETLDYCALLSTGEDGERGCFTIAAASELLPADDEVREKVKYKFNGIKQNLITIFSRGQQQGVFKADTQAEVMAETVFMLLEGMRVYGKVKPDFAMLKLANDFIMNSVLIKHAAG
ncbi:TetR family transcriptional regulator [Rouxiella sp. S1S-2]|uniref:TetR/AcrR family transcriptional regulator n=1 Tax=Rouxiella sp. S1S-2 TaxID=2653856 RepID=UPI001264555E|nr:TetR/AcrR family transcriptional regulator [Rouxiella sp. S1S-2]KAB7898931.1 TetR family transcriptional regulator [Rouxiella sp. S1S-2]